MCKLLLKHYETTLLVSNSKSSIIFEGLSILRSKRLLTFISIDYVCLLAHLHKYQVLMPLLCVSERDKDKRVSSCDSLVDFFFISP